LTFNKLRQVNISTLYSHQNDETFKTQRVCKS